MRVAPVGPKEEDSIEEGLYVGHLIHAGRKHPQEASVALGVPILVQVVDRRYHSAISVWIVDVLDVSGSVARITGHMSLGPFLDDDLIQTVVAVQRQARAVRYYRAQGLNEIVDFRAALLATVNPYHSIASYGSSSVSLCS